MTLIPKKESYIRLIKVLYIAPHLSTGGMPQYLYWLINKANEEGYITSCVEWDNITGGVYTVQRNRIENISHLHTLGDNKAEILSIIEKENPNIISFQDIPEDFISDDILKQIYKKDRRYLITVTSHSMYNDPSKIKFTADRFDLVSRWSYNKFKQHFNNCNLLEYQYKPVKFNSDVKKELGFDSSKINFLHVGLFTPGKNQKHIVEIAKLCKDLPFHFHFVGNQAENFEFYWEPIMKDFPNNCTWHGEQSNVDMFYEASDAFIFPSKFELNPLSVIEAKAYNLKLFLTKLETYESTYDSEGVYISGNNPQADKEILVKEMLGFKIQAIHMLSQPESSREQKSIASISQLTRFGIDYIQQNNGVYDGPVPIEFCRRPQDVVQSIESDKIGYGLSKITSRHYGCYLAHKRALESINQDKYDYTLIFEGDAIIRDIDKFMQILREIMSVSLREDAYFISLSNNYSISKEEISKSLFKTEFLQDLTHAYMIPNSCKDWYMDRIKDTAWDSADLWYNHMFCHNPKTRLTTKDEWVYQTPGPSLLTKK